MLKRMLCVDQFGEPGGGQAILGDVVRGALAAGIDVHAALPPGSFATELQNAGAQVHDLMVPSLHGHRKTPRDGGRLGLQLWSLSSEIRRIACGVRPDLLHVNGGRVLLPAALARVACPLTFHAHTAYVDGPTLLATRWALRRSRCRAVIAPSPFMRLWVYRRLGVAPASIAMIWNWVDDGFFANQRMPRPLGESGPARIVVLGRIAPVKGQEVAVAAFRSLPARIREQCVLEIRGPVDTETDGRAFLRRLEQRCAGDARIRLRPGQADAHEVLGAADVCVVPSLFEETFGLVAAEAMAAGVPVVVGDRGALPGVVEEAGVIVPVGDAPALKAALTRLLPDTERRAALALAGRRRAEAHFERERQVAEVLRVMARAAGGHASAPVPDR